MWMETSVRYYVTLLQSLWIHCAPGHLTFISVCRIYNEQTKRERKVFISPQLLYTLRCLRGWWFGLSVYVWVRSCLIENTQTTIISREMPPFSMLVCFGRTLMNNVVFLIKPLPSLLQPTDTSPPEQPFLPFAKWTCQRKGGVARPFLREDLNNFQILALLN